MKIVNMNYEYTLFITGGKNNTKKKIKFPT